MAATGWLRRGGADAALLVIVVVMAYFLQWVVSIGTVRQLNAPDQPWHIVEGGLWSAVLLLVLLAPLWSKRLLSNAVLGQLGCFPTRST
jgi:hypothetical protein